MSDHPFIPNLEPTIFDLRRTPRHKTLQSARIALYDSDSLISCAIRNVSNDGAKITVENAARIPDIFSLIQPTEPKRHCRTIWRDADEIGVQFIMEPLRI
jgi:hypothetical protein